MPRRVALVARFRVARSIYATMHATRTRSVERVRAQWLRVLDAQCGAKKLTSSVSRDFEEDFVDHILPLRVVAYGIYLSICLSIYLHCRGRYDAWCGA